VKSRQLAEKGFRYPARAVARCLADLIMLSAPQSKT